MASFDRVANIYDATRSLRPKVMDKVVDGITQFLGESSVVDFGVGTGRFAAPLARSEIEVAGVDISMEMIRQAREKGVGSLALAAAEFAPFRTGSFDYAMVVHFMHLVNDWKATIKEIARVTTKGLMTVVEDPQGFRPRDLYLQLRESKGFPMPGLKLGERQMISMVEPSTLRELVKDRRVFDPSALLDEYSAKLHSITWDMPDGVNAAIVEEMRKKLGERRELEGSVSLAVWGHEKLRKFYPSP